MRTTPNLSCLKNLRTHENAIHILSGKGKEIINNSSREIIVAMQMLFVPSP
jgi:hypothetical protein